MTTARRQRLNVFLLTVSQALFQTVTVLVVALSGLVGYELAEDKSLATLPIAASVVGTAVLTIPASLLMGRIGRRGGFIVGSLLGVVGGALSAAAIAWGDFALFCLGNLLIGGYRAFAQFYRFAAAEAAGPEFRSRAISLVLAGGIVAALAMPTIARSSREFLPDMPYAGVFLAATALSLLATLVLVFLRIEEPKAAEQAEPARPLGQIARQPLFLISMAAAAVGYAVMNLVMTATPLAMVAHHHSVDDATFVIEWHMLGMFVPSFFTGSLIRRLGAPLVMLGGVGLFAGHVAIALSGYQLLHFGSALVLLGVGWNFLYIGGTTLLTETYRPAEKAKAEALNDFLIFGVVTASSFSSGALQHGLGWEILNLSVLPVLAATAVMLLWLIRQRAASAAPAIG